MAFSDTELDDSLLEEFAGGGKFGDQPDPEGAQMGDETFSCDEPGCGFTTKSLPGLRRHTTRQHGRADEAPPGGTTPKSTAAAGRRAGGDKIHEQAEAFCMVFYGMFGGIWSQADPVCGGAWMSCQPAAVEAWANAARKNPTVARMLAGVENVGVFGALFVAHMPIIQAVQEHHIRPRIEAARAQREAETYEPEPEQPEPVEFHANGGAPA